MGVFGARPVRGSEATAVARTFGRGTVLVLGLNTAVLALGVVAVTATGALELPPPLHPRANIRGRPRSVRLRDRRMN
jgi:hypothetical protein